MTGPEHYAEAERLLWQADRHVSVNMEALTGERKADVIAAAQVHARLAQVAATMDLTGATVNGVVSPGWKEALA